MSTASPPTGDRSLDAPAAVISAAIALRAALVDLDPRLLRGPDCARVAEELAATEKACAGARLMTAARAVDSGAHLSMGFSDGATWLARQSGVTSGQAKRDLDSARLLEDCEDTRQALMSGQISKDQAQEIAGAEAAVPGAERQLLDLARTADLSKLRERSRHVRHARTPAADLRRQQQQARSFRHWRDRLGMVCFAGQLPPEVGVPFVARLEQATARARREARSSRPGAPPERWEAHAADALAQLCAPGAGERRTERAALVVVCDLFAWRRGHSHPGEACHIIGGGPIPVEVAGDLCQDAFVKAVLHDGTRIHTIKHFGRHLPAELRTALDLGPVPEFTGRECAECGKRWGLEYDHIDPVSRSGPTSYENLQALCWADHQAKTRRDRRAGRTPGQPGAPPDDR